MKTLRTRCLAAMAGVVMTIALAGCGGGEDSASTATSQQLSSAQANQQKKPADTLRCAP
ncbi:hypothetical protein [Cupriavidus sp. CP313]